MKIDRPAQRKGRIEMIPLIDCMFIVLVFFIYAMLSMTVHRGIDVQLPRVGAPKVNQHEPVIVSVNADGQITVGQESVALTELESALRQRAEEGVESVYVNADREAKQSMVTPIYRRIGQAGIDHMVILTEGDQAQ